MDWSIGGRGEFIGKVSHYSRIHFPEPPDSVAKLGKGLSVAKELLGLRDHQAGFSSPVCIYGINNSHLVIISTLL